MPFLFRLSNLPSSFSLSLVLIFSFFIGGGGTFRTTGKDLGPLFVFSSFFLHFLFPLPKFPFLLLSLFLVFFCFSHLGRPSNALRRSIIILSLLFHFYLLFFLLPLLHLLSGLSLPVVAFILNPVYFYFHFFLFLTLLILASS